MEHSIRASTTVLFALYLACAAKYTPKTGLLNEMPKNCTGKDFCLIKHKNYPQKEIDTLISIKYNLYLGNPHEEFHIKQGYGLGEEFCDKDTDKGLIYEIVDRNNKIRVVVQSPGQFEQMIAIEQCRFPGVQTKNTLKGSLSSTVLKHHKFSCEEKKMDFTFVVLSEDGEQLEYVKSKSGIPVCCYCKLDKGS